MDYISTLTEDEVKFLCENIIPHRTIREYFLHYPKEFHKLFPGREAKKLSSHEVMRMVVDSRGKPFVSNLLNSEIDASIQKIRNEIAKRMEDGDSEQLAYLRSLSNSLYKDCPDLFCKLNASNTSTEYEELLCEAIKLFRDFKKALPSSASPGNSSSENPDYNDELSNLSDKLSEAEAENMRLKDEYSEILALLEEERHDHQKTIEELQDEADNTLQQLDFMRRDLDDAHLKLDAAEQELELYHHLMERADYPEGSQKQSDYPYISLCRVEGLNAYHNGIKLKRLTDVEDGYILPQTDADFPSRTTLYENFRTDMASGFIGVWLWKLEYNPASGRSDYVQSAFQYCPAEIKILTNCNTPTDIKETLLSGVEFSPSGNKILFACATGSGEYKGFLCRLSDFNKNGNTLSLKLSVFDLGLYSFTEQEIVRISGLLFYIKTYVGLPESRFPVKNPMDVVRDKVLSIATSTTLKPYGFSNRERQLFHRFLNTLTVSDFYSEISSACGCSVSQAKQYADDFVLSAEKHLDSEDLNDSVLTAIIAHSSDLLKRCKKSLEEDWGKEFAEKITTANEELDQVRREVKKKVAESTAIDNEYKRVIQEKERVEAEIEQRQSFLIEVESNLATRMENAKRNASAFAAEMMSLMPFLSQTSENKAISVPLSATHIPYYAGKDIDPNIVVEASDWNMFVDDLQDNLIKAGISERNVISDTLSWDFAAYFYVSILNRVPIIFAGPNGKDIIDAFSCTRFGRTAGILDCSLPFSYEGLEKCKNSVDKVIAVLNPLTPSWIEHISEMVSMPGKYVFAVQPFAEDLMVEPRGLYNYFLPTLTELLVCNNPQPQSYSGGYCGENFKDWNRQTSPNRVFKTAQYLGVSEFTQVRMKSLFYDFSKICKSTGMDLICLFSLFPYAYLTGQSKKLLDMESLAISDKAKKFFRAYLGDTE